jgi:hypothetical protein
MEKSIGATFGATLAVVLLASRLAAAQDLSAPRQDPDQYPLGGWISLTLANHAVAAFDAATTRRSIMFGNHEDDPLDQPFVNSNSLYLVTQIGPLIPDALGYWMLRNDRKWVRHIWWLPQMAYIFFNGWNAIHNVRISQ